MCLGNVNNQLCYIGHTLCVYLYRYDMGKILKTFLKTLNCVYQYINLLY